MASASRALLLYRASPLHAAASRFLCPLAAAGSLLLAALVPSPAAARRFTTQPANSSLRDPSRPVMAQSAAPSGAWSNDTRVRRRQATADARWLVHRSQRGRTGHYGSTESRHNVEVEEEWEIGADEAVALGISDHTTDAASLDPLFGHCTSAPPANGRPHHDGARPISTLGHPQHGGRRRNFCWGSSRQHRMAIQMG
ncbi:hypothetical protein ZWY2020_018649 [Hordeum vulgare]|nr:hypothetical protein ZWY2020_018649 [Hordeum vulgare]